MSLVLELRQTAVLQVYLISTQNFLGYLRATMLL